MPKMGMNTKLWSLKYTPKTATAVEEKAMRIWFIRKVITEPMDCMMTDGTPMERMRRSIAPSGLKRLSVSLTSGFFLRHIVRPTAALIHWPRIVASAAPATPMRGIPNRPKIRIGSSTMLMTVPTSWLYMVSTVRPVLCSRRSKRICMNRPRQPTVTMPVYITPPSTISAMSVCASKYRRLHVAPSSMNAAAHRSIRNRPLLAALETLLSSFAPSARESTALRPTPRPAASATIKFCTGKAMLRAVSAFSLTRATNMESTMLYSAMTSMEAIIGTLMFTSSLPTGMTPILFSCV